MKAYEQHYTQLLDKRLNVFIVVADFEQLYGSAGTEDWIKKMHWDGTDQLLRDPRKLYYYKHNGEQKLGGFYKRHENMNLGIIYGSHHMTEAEETTVHLNMVQDMLSSLNGLQCHHSSDVCLQHKLGCDLMNDCNGHGSCVEGKCLCDKNYVSADCSI